VGKNLYKNFPIHPMLHVKLLLVWLPRVARVNSMIEADVWFEPVVVIEILGAEITLSPIHTCVMDAIRKGNGLAIRFPRFSGGSWT
jgi:DNA ligase-1